MLRIILISILLVSVSLLNAQEFELPLEVDTKNYYSELEFDHFKHTTAINSLIFTHTLWKTETVLFHLGKIIEGLKKCKVRVAEARILKANLAEFDAENQFEKDMEFITEETLASMSRIINKKYDNKGSVLLYLDTNGSVDGTLGLATSGARQASIFYHQFSPLMTGNHKIASIHTQTGQYSVPLHEVVHLYSQVFPHEETMEEHILHGDKEKANGNILESHCKKIRNSNLVKKVQ